MGRKPGNKNKTDGESSRHKRLKIVSQDSEPHGLPLKYLREITDNFSDERLLGKGGFGNVYKGVAQNGNLIAVKKLTSTMPGIQDRQFENEVHHLMKLKHPNIVQLVGYCSETETIPVPYKGKYVFAEKSERLLCLEYLPKGSLHRHISDESSGLDWYTRYKIIKGICYGLHYLHEGWKVKTPIIHMDLKPPNILLDDNMVPKIADFGLSRLFGEEQTRTCTKSREGTLGYMAPEYLNRGIITKKLDIFSLGVIIIEIITGCKEYPFETETSSQKFIQLVLKNWISRLEESPSYASRETDCEQISRCIQIGLVCVNVDWEERPTTSEIIKMLRGSEGAGCSNESQTSRSSSPAATAMLHSIVPTVILVDDNQQGHYGEAQAEEQLDEDQTLANYWNIIARDTGLKQVDLTGDNFTADEQRLVLEQHSRSGNSFSEVAGKRAEVVDKGGPNKNIIIERRRREHMNEMFYSLRSLVPNITKMDKASIIKNAIDYIRHLQAEERQMRAPVHRTGEHCSSTAGSPSRTIGPTSKDNETRSKDKDAEQ